MILGATLYVKNSIEAAQFYCNAFNMTIGYNAKHENDTYLHAELEKDGNSIFAVSESSDEAVKEMMLSVHQPTMSLGINLGSTKELYHAYSELIKGGHIIRSIGPLPWSPCSADVVDKFGVCWYIYVSQHRPD
jgi:PhnB protein